MKKGILFLLLLASAFANAQSLKEALYGGKLKNDSGSVVRKTDDLSTKIDTSKRKPVEADKNKTAVVIKDTAAKSPVATADTKVVPVISDTAVAIASPAATTTSTAPKTNTQVWKQFIDSASAQLKKEVLPDKRIKSGTYYILVDYDIAEDGQVVINNATPDPADRYLQEMVRQVLEVSPPKMTPVISNGKAKRVSKKYNFVLTKD